MIEIAIRRIVDGQHLGRDEMHEVFGEVMDGRASDTQKSALLIALRMKGETADEITGAAMAMRERVTPLTIDRDRIIDTCGTGGDGRGTFNVSTVAALVAAGAGASVAKHGNRAVSSSCGSADVLAALGVNIDLDAARMSDVLRRTGISFLFAPKLHPAMGAVAAIRRELGVRTIFNVLGPLTNPAFARRQVLGVYSLHLVDLLAQVLLALGADHAMVVHSRDGLDEISISAPTHVCEVIDGELRSYELTPEELGIARRPLDAIAGGDARENARIARETLSGGNGACTEIVAANAGAALYVSGAAETIRDGVAMAREAIANGAAMAKLQELVAVTNE
ncbi:MAG: anthranilate phosphoribosyltransferase [Acidobacteria bacterium]|nr:anthranilate phosphoribosyltransferase [Acidobacteriota bacterium]MBV9067782.1 anthranilate phosphoribosyltransferase [Acidobacteriota bacterium]MBV9184887.1 anthranilate phosphoribosyltransferase [Acidobacteriota bacterium]